MVTSQYQHDNGNYYYLVILAQQNHKTVMGKYWPQMYNAYVLKMHVNQFKEVQKKQSINLFNMEIQLFRL